uniref:Ig-like domain-containing protein n=1 Tax=Gouania willdenowi TaxID=441366 RepID=A0A8C5GNW7_GOUWI
MSSDWLLGGFTLTGLSFWMFCSSTDSLNEHSDLYWYKQEVNSYPKFILRRSRYSADNSPEFVKDRFDAELKDSSVPLMIQDLHVCDSAVYYCALRSDFDKNSSL